MGSIARALAAAGDAFDTLGPFIVLGLFVATVGLLLQADALYALLGRRHRGD